MGWNYGACATCGGFYLNLSPDTTISSSTYYVLDYPVALNGEIAGFFAQYNKNHLPIYVSVNWQLASLSDPGAPANWIRVLDIKAR